MDKKFPKITFDTFGFALANKCKVQIWIDDCSIHCLNTPNYVIRVNLVKGEKSISLAVTYIDAYHTDELFNKYLAMQINNAMKQLDESLEEEL